VWSTDPRRNDLMIVEVAEIDLADRLVEKVASLPVIFVSIRRDAIRRLYAKEGVEFSRMLAIVSAVREVGKTSVCSDENFGGKLAVDVFTFDDYAGPLRKCH
jgi:hypothetical protein